MLSSAPTLPLESPQCVAELCCCRRVQWLALCARCWVEEIGPDCGLNPQSCRPCLPALGIPAPGADSLVLRSLHERLCGSGGVCLS